ncbi:TetR/AcrR family transcriptional regulator, partial [bacterium]|nr:TetR/AcrR family transcriptional regulator [bacterium]
MDKRIKIIESATELFARRGYHGTPVPKIAENAGVAVGTIYRYFPDKERLASEAYCHWKQAATAAVLAVYDRALAPREQLRRSWRAMCAFALAHPAAIRFTEFMSGPYLNEPARAACRRYN